MALTVMRKASEQIVQWGRLLPSLYAYAHTLSIALSITLSITVSITLDAHDGRHPDKGPAASAMHPSSFSCGVGSCHNPNRNAKPDAFVNIVG